MMIEGLWTVEYEGIPNFLGGGVVLLARNRVYGGDSDYYYTGLYGIKDDSFDALVEAIAFSPDPTSVFGTNDKRLSVRVVGKIKDGIIVARCSKSDLPQVQVSLILKKRAEFQS